MVSLLVALSGRANDCRQTLGIVERAKEDRAGWSAFLGHFQGTRPRQRRADRLGWLHGPDPITSRQLSAAADGRNRAIQNHIETWTDQIASTR